MCGRLVSVRADPRCARGVGRFRGSCGTSRSRSAAGPPEPHHHHSYCHDHVQNHIPSSSAHHQRRSQRGRISCTREGGQLCLALMHLLQRTTARRKHLHPHASTPVCGRRHASCFTCTQRSRSARQPRAVIAGPSCLQWRFTWAAPSACASSRTPARPTLAQSPHTSRLSR